MTDTATIKIETGKYYRTMSGDIVGPVVWDELISVWRRNKNFVRNTGDYWHEDGSRYGHIASDEDLIEEVTASILSETVPTPPGEPQLVEHENGVNISLQHASDCALHNGPALPVGPCDCHISKSRNEPVIPFQSHSCTSLPVMEGDKALALFLKAGKVICYYSEDGKSITDIHELPISLYQKMRNSVGHKVPVAQITDEGIAE